MKILVTGSSGYIGSSFMNYFQHKYNFVRFSLRDDSLENSCFENINVVLHCAALVHQTTDHPYEKYEEVNVKYPLSLAIKAKESGVKHFIFISTIAVYGRQNELLQEDTVCNPETFYGKSKLKAENGLQKLEDADFKVSIVRLPMIYGKDAPGNMGSLISILERVPLLPFGKIRNKRSFLYIEHLLHFINAIIEKQKSGIILVSDDKPLSTTDLINVISHALHKKVYLIDMPFFALFLKFIKPKTYHSLYENLWIDSSDTKEKLNLKNTYTTSEGIIKMFDKISNSQDSRRVR